MNKIIGLIALYYIVMGGIIGFVLYLAYKMVMAYVGSVA